MSFNVGDRVTLQNENDFYDAIVKEINQDVVNIQFDGMSCLTTVLPEQLKDLLILEEEL